MFWRFGSYANISTIETLLDKSDVTLDELLDEADLLQELRQHNTKLIEFLRDENVLGRLLEYVIDPKATYNNEGGADEPDEATIASGFARAAAQFNAPRETDEARRSRLACEILSSGTWSLSEALMENMENMRKFWAFLERDAPLDPVQAAYFTKVNEALLGQKTDEMMAFFVSLDNIVPTMLKHVECPMIMDLLLKIISMEKVENGVGIVDWLQSRQLIPILLSFLSPEYSPTVQTSTGDFLKAIITISANASQHEQSCIGPNDLTRQLVSEPCVKALIGDMLKGGNSLTVGVGIIIEVIRKNNSDYDPENLSGVEQAPSSRDPIYLGSLLRLFASHVPDFMDLIMNQKETIINPDGTITKKNRELKAAYGGTIEPLGFNRFKTCELMAELLHCSNMALLNEKGSDRYVKERDRERERIKALREKAREGQKDATYSQDLGGFRFMGVMGEKGPLEVQNGGDNSSDGTTEDDGFEDVTAEGLLGEEDLSKANTDNARDEDDVDMLLEDVPETQPLQPVPKAVDESDVFVDEPLSPLFPADTSSTTDEQKNNTPIPKIQLISPAGAETKPAASPPSTPSGALGQELKKVSISDEKPEAATSESSSKDKAVQGSDVKEQSTASDSSNLLVQSDDTTVAPLSIKKSSTPPPPYDEVAPSTQSSTTTAAESTSPKAEVAPVSTEEKNADQPPPSVETSSEMKETSTPSKPEVPEQDFDGYPVVGDYLKMQFVEHKVVVTILDFFFRFPWNNFLHNVVYDVVQQVFNGPMDRGYNRTLAIDLFVTGRITERIMEGQRFSDKTQRETRMRMGYMGHLTLIAEEVVKFTEKYPLEVLSQVVLEKVMHADWIDYVDNILSETRERDNAILGGFRPDQSLGPRSGVSGSITGLQGLGGIGAGGATGGSITGVSGSLSSADLDTIDLANGTGGVGSGGSGSFGTEGSGGLAISGGGSGVLSSGFGSSSDEDEDDLDQDDDDEDGRLDLGRVGSSSGMSMGIGGSSSGDGAGGLMANDQVGDLLFDDDIDPEDVDEDLIAKYFPIFEE
ncbi:SIT4-associating protein-like protein SAP190 [Peziza echinospora]|nr:SIT4-associating protein-like protein SAP190 [Peziza echinospora]